MARLPRPLAAVLVVVAITGVAWALFEPAFQVTDEDVHFSYVHTLAEEGRLPGGEGAPLAGEFYGAIMATNSKAVNFRFGSKPEWSQPAYERWLRQEGALARSDGGGPNGASGYPPAYYASLVPAYAVAGGDLFTRLTAARLASVAWLLIGALGAWLLAGEMFKRQRRLQVVAAATVGMWPMATYVGAGVNPDAMQNAVWTLSFWVGARILTRGLSPRDGLAFGALVGLALITKATSLALLPAAAFVALWGTWRLLRADGVRRALVAAAPLAIAFAVPVVAWLLLTSSLDRPAYGQAGIISTSESVPGRPFLIREFLSYVWQFYLPKLPFMTEIDVVNEVISNHGLHNIWIGHFFGVFGWTNVWMPFWAYDIWLAVLLVVVAAAIFVALRAVRRAGRVRSAVARAFPWAAYFGLAVATVLAGLHLTEYRQYIGSGAPFMQGRYLLPLIGLFALLVAAAITALPRRWRGVGAGLWLGGLVAHQLAALGMIMARFYA